MYLVYVPQGQSSLPRNQVRVTRADINKEQSHLSYSDRTGCSQYDMKKKRTFSHVLSKSSALCIFSGSCLIISENAYRIHYRYDYTELGSTHPRYPLDLLILFTHPFGHGALSLYCQLNSGSVSFVKI